MKAALAPIAAVKAAVVECEAAVAFRSLPKPREQGGVVVRADIGDAVLRIVVRQMRGIRIGLKAELDDAHPRKARVLQKLYHVFAESTEILRHNGDFAERGFHRVKKFFTGAFLPNALARGLGVGGHRPIRSKGAEMVDAHRVIERPCGGNAVAPPSVIVLFHRRPVIQRVAP